MKLVDNSNKYVISDDYRLGSRLVSHRLAGIAADEYTEDELRGMLMALEVISRQLKGQLVSMRRNKRENFKLEIVK